LLRALSLPLPPTAALIPTSLRQGFFERHTRDKTRFFYERDIPAKSAFRQRQSFSPKLIHYPFAETLIVNRTATVVFLFCTPAKWGTGTAGKDSLWTSEFGQRLRFASSHRIPSRTLEAALVALAGRLVNGRVSPCSSSASIPDSNAD
jgi:hypothetical protein